MIDWLPEDLPPKFPHTHSALTDPNANGLLAAGGRLTPEWLLHAYQQGIFPWYDKESPILWWSPAPRMILTPTSFRLGRSLNKAMRRQNYTITCNQAFSAVIHQCSLPRDKQADTWITDEMKFAYLRMHINDQAMSAEYWDKDGHLAGGLYGIRVGTAFFGESMFSRTSNASKITFAHFAKALFDSGIELIDCQMHTDHLAGFGAEEVDRDEFELRLSKTILTDSTPIAGVIANNKAENNVRR